MQINIAIPIFALILASTDAFHVGYTTQTPNVVTSTSLEARRLMVPILSRPRPSSSMLFPDVNRIFREIDEMMESSFSELSLPSSMLATYPQARGLGLHQSLGFDITEDEKEFKISMNLSGVEVKDVDLHLDSDGRVVRLKGHRVQEEGGMKISSSFEKAILLHPDVDTEKISASLDGGVLNIVAPKIAKEEVVEEKKASKIHIHVAEAKSEETNGVTNDNNVALPDENDSPNVSTHLPVESLKNEKVQKKTKKSVSNDNNEKKWPARDFPY